MTHTSAGVIRSFAEFRSLQREWDALFAGSPAASPFLDFDWLRQWLQLYGPLYTSLENGLRVVLFRREGELVGALPLYLRQGDYPFSGRRCVRFIGTGEEESEETCPEYLDLLSRPENDVACLDALSDLLQEGDEFSWKQLCLDALSETSPLLLLPRRLGPDAQPTLAIDGVCPIANLRNGWDAYLEQLEPEHRGQYRRMLRKAEQGGARLELAATGTQVDASFEQLVLLHQQRWLSAGQPGCFSAERFRWFHHALAQAWVPEGRAVLARLTREGKPLAILYGFICRGRFYFYQSGVRVAEDEAVRYPGLVAHLYLMQALAARGLQEYDFMMGESFYKQKFATDSITLRRLTLERPSWVRYYRDAFARVTLAARR